MPLYQEWGPALDSDWMESYDVSGLTAQKFNHVFMFIEALRES